MKDLVYINQNGVFISYTEILAMPIRHRIKIVNHINDRIQAENFDGEKIE